MTDAWLEPLPEEDCLRLLREGTVGRIAFMVGEDPIILPVNYRLAEPPSGPLLALRTRPGNVIEQAPTNVAFEIDNVDSGHHQGWSVVVRGELLHAESESPQFRECYDPVPWLSDRSAWLLIAPWAITGRTLHGDERVWPVRPGEYM